MSKIQKAFENGKAFIGFVTGGNPSIEKSCELILNMAESGADLIEIGIPFSDPIAEGPVIQEANIRALAAGADTEAMFHIVETVRKQTEVPLVFLTYLNPVFKYGYERFFARCERVGLDGIIIPDLPFEEKGELAGIAESHHVDVISLIAPTSADRIRKIAADAKGFLYLVSSMGVTGMRSEIKTDLTSIIETVRSVSKIPVAVGFGISTPEQAHQISKLADGVIVGSAIVKLVEQYGENAGSPLSSYVSEMKASIRTP